MKKRYIISGIIIIVAIVGYRQLFLDFGTGIPKEGNKTSSKQEEALTASVSGALGVKLDGGKISDTESFEITGNKDVDEYIRKIAEEHGYQKQNIASENEMEYLQGQALISDVIFSFQSMQEEMKKLGMDLVLVSGYRSPERQREIFLNKLGDFDADKILSGQMDEEIDSILSQSSIPGYSKHHTGLAIDVGCGNYVLDYSFTESDCYKWLSKDDFSNSKKYNFHPSYPFGVEKQGPEPEPWEFVWSSVL